MGPPICLIPFVSRPSPHVLRGNNASDAYPVTVLMLCIRAVKKDDTVGVDGVPASSHGPRNACMPRMLLSRTLRNLQWQSEL